MTINTERFARMLMKTLRWTFLLVAALVVGWFIGWGITGNSGIRDDKAHAQLLDFANAVAIGDSRSKVVELSKKPAYDRLRFGHYECESVAQTPIAYLTFSNWLLWIEYRADQVSAVRFRGTDGKGHRLPDAPDDRGQDTPPGPGVRR